MNDNNRKGKNWRAKYLQKADFEAWCNNHFATLIRTVKMQAIMIKFILAFVALILGLLGILMAKVI